jgi:hypothetical protein
MDAAALRRSSEQLSAMLNDSFQAMGYTPFADKQRPASKRQRRPKQPPPDPNADLLRQTMPQLVFAFLTVADLLDPAGARRRQEQAEQQPTPDRPGTQTADCTPPPGWFEEHQRHMDAWSAANRRKAAQKAAQTRKQRRAR